MTRQPYFHPHPLMRHMQQATPARRRGHVMQYAALCIVASVAVAAVTWLFIGPLCVQAINWSAGQL